jgi:tRNA G18 (ribose-2'-O)-methylase SpoU
LRRTSSSIAISSIEARPLEDEGLIVLERITGPADPRIAEYRDVAEPELVRSRGLFVAEGRLVVRRLIEDGRYRVRSVLVSDASFRSLEATLALAGEQVPVYLCETADFLAVTGHDLHRGCLALVERPAPVTVDAILEAVSRVSVATLVVLEALTNADNVGAVFRSAAALGAAGVLISPTCCDPLYRKAIRTSMAATLRLPFARVERWPGGVETLRASGFTIVALTPRDPSITLDRLADEQRPPRIALLVGTEGPGLTPAAEAVSDVRVRIPIAPDVDSLNLAVAVGIALYGLRETRVRAV